MNLNTSKTNFRWLVVSMLFLISMLNYIDRASMGYAITLIAKDFQFSEGDIGLILGAFGIGYIFSTFLGGVSADTFGAKKTLTISTILWSISILSLGLCGNFYMFVLLRVFFGLSEGPNFPCVTRAISDWLPADERARAFTFSLIAVPISLGIGGLLVSWVISHVGWRYCFIALSILTILWVPIWLKFFTNLPKDSQYVNSAELEYIQKTSIISDTTKNGKISMRLLCLEPTLLTNHIGYFVFGFYLNFFMTWLPTYLMNVQHIPFNQLGGYTLLPWGFAALMLWAVGLLSDKIFQKTKSYRLSRTYPIIISQLLAASFVIAINFTHELSWIVCFITLGVGFSMSANAPFYAVNVDIAKTRAASSLGIMSICFSLSSIIAPALSGYIVSLTGRFDVVFYFMTALSLSSVVLMFLFHNKNTGKPALELSYC